MAGSQQLVEVRRDVEDQYGWTRQGMLDLVEAYRNRPNLYQHSVSGSSYHNREERARSWVEIAEVMGREEDEVRAKMKSIRTQYARIIQKGTHPKSKTGNHVSSWWLLESLRFLDDFITPRKTDTLSIKDDTELDMSQVSQIGRIYPDEMSNSVENGDNAAEMVYEDIPVAPDMSQTPGTSMSNGTEHPTDEVTVIHDTSPYQSPYTAQRISPIPLSRPAMSNYRPNRPKVRKTARPMKKMKRDYASSSISLAMNSNSKNILAPSSEKRTSSEEEEGLNGNLLLKTVLAFAERSTRDDDDDSVFGRYVGNEMRNVMDEQAKRIAKMRIQKVLFEAQTGWTETSNDGVYDAPRDGITTQESNFPVGVVCGTNNTRVI